MQSVVPSVQEQRASFDTLQDKARNLVYSTLMPTDQKQAEDPRMQQIVGAATDVVLEFLNIIATLTGRGPLHVVPAMMALSVGLPNNPFWRDNMQYLTPVLVACQMSALESVRVAVGEGSPTAKNGAELQSALAGGWLIFISAVAIALHGPKWAAENCLLLKQRLLEVFNAP